MLTLKEIKKIISKQKNYLRENYSVMNIGIFGSYIRGEEKRSSDVDIIVDFKKPVGLLKIVSLENYLTDLLGVKVDIVPKNNIRKELRKDILDEVVTV